jgi:nucleoside-diphosphate-sugar epimerase
MSKILITGGAGYKGTKLAESFLKQGHTVTILDNFMYGFNPVLGFVADPNCNILKQDIRSIREADLKDYDFIYHLAGISGYPACEANPHLAEVTNITATKRMVSLLSQQQVLVYASTTSFYGSSGKIRNEDSIPEPTCLYSITKYEAEKTCMGRENSVSLRFATLFGTSRRMRCDLIVNDFVFKAMNERSLVLFDSNSTRTFLHLNDAIAAYNLVLMIPEKMKNNIYNVGSNDMNFTKLELAKKIQKHIDFKIIDSNLPDLDVRNFIINYDKINKLGFKAKTGIDEGIEELIKLYTFYEPVSVYQNAECI